MGQSAEMSFETRQTAAHTGAAEPDASERAVLVVYEGDGDATTTRVIEIADGAQLTIGRVRSANIHVDSERASRIHARISRRGPQLTIEDAGSRNGTWVNGAAITAPHRLASGDEIVIGPATMVVSLTTPVAARPNVQSIRYLEERLAAEVERGQLYRRVFSLLRIRLVGELDAIDEAIDRVAAAVRVMDVVAEYAPHELAIVMPELEGVTATERANELATAARVRAGTVVPGLDVRVGLASFPAHATTSGELIARAGAAVDAVRHTDQVGVPPPDEHAATPLVVDPQMRRVYELVHKVADHPITVLVCGETGVGKEVVAAAIHHGGSRRHHPLVRVNCPSLPEALLESELFGHERGAFTGADRRKHGYFEAANGGTLFLDEIGEISAAMQTKLLRVLQDRLITRVGGTEEIEVDVRVVCATNRDLEREVARGAFRSDLFFRISAFTIFVPPLRDRPDEIEALAEHFVRLVNPKLRLSPAAIEALRRYAWPGNVRELRNAIERACVVHAGEWIEIEDLPDRVRDVRVTTPLSPVAIALDGRRDVRDHMADLERDAIIAVLEACHGSQTEAAKKLGLTRRALIYRMEKHGLKPHPASRR